MGEGLGVEDADKVISLQTTPPLDDLPLPATSEVQWVGAHLAAFAPQRQSPLGNCCASCTLGNSHVGVGVTTSNDSHTYLLQHQQYTPGLQTAVNKLLPKGAIEPVFHPETKGFFSCLFPGAKDYRGPVSCHRSLPPE